MSEGLEDRIAEILLDYPEANWLSQIKSEFPDMDTGAILSIIEALSGGDLEELS